MKEAERLKDDDSTFYTRRIAFHRFEDFCRDENYSEVPSGWSVILSDIRGSTRAIQAGRYQDVNMAGAATIAAVLNVTRGLEVPYVFGGDGATFLIPKDVLAEVRTELARTRVFIAATYGLEIRIGIVPIDELKNRGTRIQVAKFELSPGNSLAFFRGGGLAMAETLVKAEASKYLLADEPLSKAGPNLNGLSCRWQPIEAKNGVMVSILIQALNLARADEVYGEIISGLQQILDTDSNSPVHDVRFRPHWPAKSWRLETLWRENEKSLVAKFAGRFVNLAATFVLFWVMLFNLPFGPFRPKKYKREMRANADFRKFDDMLRMVLDCRHEQVERLQVFLESARAAGEIAYGLHRSNQALMTCLVFSAVQGRHVHFIDGADGGYAMAAAQLKGQLKSGA